LVCHKKILKKNKWFFNIKKAIFLKKRKKGQARNQKKSRNQRNQWWKLDTLFENLYHSYLDTKQDLKYG
jgi:hypothetical protein